MLAVRLRQPKHLAPAKTHQCRCFGHLDPAIRQIVQHAHPVDLRPAHRNHRHRPNAPQPKLWRVTSLSGPTVTSLSGVYRLNSRNDRLRNARFWESHAVARHGRTAIAALRLNWSGLGRWISDQIRQQEIDEGSH